MTEANEPPHNPPVGQVRLLMITTDGQVLGDSWVQYAYADDGTPYWADSDGAGGIAAAGSIDVDPAPLPSGVIERRADGSEVLMTVDGYLLEMDGRGGCQVWDQSGTLIPITGFFYVNGEPTTSTS